MPGQGTKQPCPPDTAERKGLYLLPWKTLTWAKLPTPPLAPGGDIRSDEGKRHARNRERVWAEGRKGQEGWNVPDISKRERFTVSLGLQKLRGWGFGLAIFHATLSGPCGLTESEWNQAGVGRGRMVVRCIYMCSSSIGLLSSRIQLSVA
jgi:hypothetical protein